MLRSTRLGYNRKIRDSLDDADCGCGRINFSTLASTLTAASGLTGGGETALLFRADHTAVALSRRDTGNFESLIRTSSGEFTQWNWHIVQERIGGAELIELPDGRIVAASRRFVGSQTTTALFWLDPTSSLCRPRKDATRWGR